MSERRLFYSDAEEQRKAPTITSEKTNIIYYFRLKEDQEQTEASSRIMASRGCLRSYPVFFFNCSMRYWNVLR